MPGIGPDIQEVMSELGTPVTVIRSPKNLTEKITYEINEQAAQAFVRLRGSLAYNTVIVPGDVLLFNSMAYLVVNKTADDFEGEVVEYSAELFPCNIPAGSLILSEDDPVREEDYTITQGWSVRVQVPYGLVIAGTRTAVLEPDVADGKRTAYKLKCMVPGTYGVQKGDRLHINSTEYYRVQDVEMYEYPGIHVLSLVEDDRAVYTP